MSDYPGEDELEAAIANALRAEAPDAVVIGWVLGVAYKTGEMPTSTGHAYFTPSGQPMYSTRGLLLITDEYLQDDTD